MRAGQAQPEAFPALHHVADAAAPREQVVEEFAALGLVPAGHGQVGPLESLRGGRDRVIGGAQHGEAGGPEHHG